MYNYSVVYSTRRTMSLGISFDNTITVRCPYGTTDRAVEEFVSSKSAWLDGHMRKNEQAALVNNELLSYGKILAEGRLLDFEIGQKDGVTDDKISVVNVRRLKGLYVKNFGGAFLARFEKVCAETGLHAHSVTFRDYKSRWGCCDPKNDIIFNYKLLMLPVGLQIYVIVHELSHTLYHNHSRNFWDTVKSYLPDYAERNREIKNYDFLTRLY